MNGRSLTPLYDGCFSGMASSNENTAVRGRIWRPKRGGWLRSKNQWPSLVCFSAKKKTPHVPPPLICHWYSSVLFSHPFLGTFRPSFFRNFRGGGERTQRRLVRSSSTKCTRGKRKSENRRFSLTTRALTRLTYFFCRKYM